MHAGWFWRLGIFCGCGVAPPDVIRQIRCFKIMAVRLGVGLGRKCGPTLKAKRLQTKAIAWG
jgi:hypothetical protein